MGIYMKFGSILGDATQHVERDKSFGAFLLHMVAGNARAAEMLGETGWIPLNNFHWGGDRNITTRAGKPQPQTRSSVAPNLHDVTVDKDVDKASCDLLQSFCEDTKGVECTIVFVRTGDPGEVYLQYKLKNTLIKNIDVKAANEGRPNETLILNYTDVELSVWRIDESNVAQGPYVYEAKDASQQSGGGHGGHGGGHGHGPHH